MANDQLGKLIDGQGERDAIHVAIAPVTTEERLFPGQEVQLVEGKADCVAAAVAGVGIVDPFLRHAVHPGQRFYVVLYPNTITSLRHVWVHPAFDNRQMSEQEQAINWIREYGQQVEIGKTYEQLIEAAEWYLDDNEYLIEGGRYEGVCLPDEFWDYFQKATGRMVTTSERGSFFSCSC